MPISARRLKESNADRWLAVRVGATCGRGKWDRNAMCGRQNGRSRKLDEPVGVRQERVCRQAHQLDEFERASVKASRLAAVL